MPDRDATITFTSDFGLTDPFVGVCHGVIAALAPAARVIDVTHGVPPQDVRTGALMLADCVGYLPAAVHLAVVDPGVGTERAGVAIEAGGHLFVGPDNGLLVAAADRLGGVKEAWELTAAAYRLEPVSRTFHGRDVFAPAAAHLATGVPAHALGPARDPDGLVRLTMPETVVDDGRIGAEVVLVDRFGNAALNVLGDDLEAAGLHLGDRVAIAVGGIATDAPLVDTFAAVPAGQLAVLVDSFGRAALAVNGGDASQWLQARRGAQVTLSRHPGGPASG